MIKLDNIEIMNFEAALRGMRNPLASWGQSDSYWINDPTGTFHHTYKVGEKDKQLALKLIRAGSDHSKFMRQILVSMDFIAPDYFWKEFDTYKVGTVANSTSTMHKITSRFLTFDDFSFDKINVNASLTLDYLNELILEYQQNQSKEVWREIIQTLPMSFNYLRTVSLNYQVLRNMYHVRKNHKLIEWREFCRIIEDLPYSEFITI